MCAPITLQILTNSAFYSSSFIVPTGNDGAEIDSRWPENIRGFRLGTRIVGEILIAKFLSPHFCRLDSAKFL